MSSGSHVSPSFTLFEELLRSHVCHSSSTIGQVTNGQSYLSFIKHILDVISGSCLPFIHTLDELSCSHLCPFSHVCPSFTFWGSLFALHSAYFRQFHQTPMFALYTAHFRHKIRQPCLSFNFCTCHQVDMFAILLSYYTAFFISPSISEHFRQVTR